METKKASKDQESIIGEYIPASKEERYPQKLKKNIGERIFVGSEAAICFFSNLLFLPFRLLWNLIVIGGAITLTVLWLGFVFGSVVGVILLLIFMPEGFLLPMGLIALVIPLWEECE